MATFYIDYENVHNAGTTGIEQLSNKDSVYLFYSVYAGTMTMETVRHFLDSRCAIELVEADNGTANALDFQLIAFLFSGINKDDYHYIISKDNGYEAAVKMAYRMGMDNVKRCNTIEKALHDYMNELEKNKAIELADAEESQESARTVVCIVGDNEPRKIVEARIQKMVQEGINITLPQEELEISCDGITTCNNKLNLYHFLRKQLGDKRGRSVYNIINAEFDQLKMDLAM